MNAGQKKTFYSVVVVCSLSVCSGQSLRLGMSGWSCLALGMANQSND